MAERGQWARIIDGIAASIEAASDEEILDDARREGRDPEVVAERVRATARQTVRAFGGRQLAEAGRAGRGAAAESGATSPWLPAGPLQRRAALARAYQSAGPAVTAQDGELDELTDEDVAARLEGLHELGALDGLCEGGGDD